MRPVGHLRALGFWLLACGTFFLCITTVTQAQVSGQDLLEYYARQEKGARQGDPTYQYLFGRRYLTGEGVKQDRQIALQWIRAAATNENKEFPLSPGYRKEVDELLRGLEGREASPVNRELKPTPKAENRNTLTFTDQTGRRYEDIEIVTVDTDGLVYLTSDKIGAGKVKFTDLPESLRARFGGKQVEAASRAAQARPEDGSPVLPQDHSGTGFFVTDDGYFLTCFHVIEGASRLVIKVHQGVFVAALVKADAARDLALLKIPGLFRPLPLAQRGSVRLGDSVFTIGFPNVALQGFEPKLTRGEVSGLAGMQDDPRHFQISVATQPGNSGGALVNSVGNVVGMVSMRLSEVAALKTSGMLPQNVNYALKCDAVIAFLEALPEVSSKLKAPHPAQGREFEHVVKEVQEATALVFAGH